MLRPFSTVKVRCGITGRVQHSYTQFMPLVKTTCDMRFELPLCKYRVYNREMMMLILAVR